MSRTLNITTKAEALTVLQSTPNCRRFPYCSGKYKWEGSARPYFGRPIDAVSEEVKAIYVEHRTDKDGPYAKMMCITSE